LFLGNDADMAEDKLYRTTIIDVDKLRSFMDREGITIESMGRLVDNRNAIVNALATGRMNRSCWVLCRLIMDVPAVRKELEKLNPITIFRKRVVTAGGVRYVSTKKIKKIDLEENDALRFYKAGESMRSIAIRHGTTIHSVKLLLMASGVTEFRTSGSASPSAHIAPIVKKLYEEGVKTKDLAERFKVSKTTIQRLVNGFYDHDKSAVDVHPAGEKEESNSERASESVREGERTLLPVRDEDKGASRGEVGSGTREPEGERRFKYFVKSEGGTRRLSQSEIEERKSGVCKGEARPGEIYRRP
jgi:transposase